MGHSDSFMRCIAGEALHPTVLPTAERCPIAQVPSKRAICVAPPDRRPTDALFYYNYQRRPPAARAAPGPLSVSLVASLLSFVRGRPVPR